MHVLCNRLDRAFAAYQQEFEEKAVQVLRSGFYVLGKELQLFEQEFAQFVGARHCIGVGNGLSALNMAIYLLGIGKEDEVIVPANTYIASVLSVTLNGATPVFVEPDAYYNIDADLIEEAITKRTKAILAVHLYGQAANMAKIMDIAGRYNLRVVEDCAQSHGAAFKGRQTGTFGDVGCFSFYPTKNLGAFGDGGALVTDDADLAEQARMFRNYGSKKKYHNEIMGVNSRLDELQAGLLRVKLCHYSEFLEERKQLAAYYEANIKNPAFLLPKVREGAETVWHQYVVRVKSRDEVQQNLKSRNIDTMIHYPIPPYLAESMQYLNIPETRYPLAGQYAREVLSLPFYNGMAEEEQEYVVENINKLSLRRH